MKMNSEYDESVEAMEDIIEELIQSIVNEEHSLSQILRSEAKKIEKIIKQKEKNDLCISTIEKINDSSKSILDTVLMKQWLMIKKLESIRSLSDYHERSTKDHHFEDLEDTFIWDDEE
jgi:predicted secreted Zn-dependent protease